MNAFGRKVTGELREMIPVTLFFFVAFQVLALSQRLMLAQYDIRVSVFVAATVGALVVAKVVLIADHFAFVNRFPDKPLIYNVAWKTAIYFAASLAVRYAERFINAWPDNSSVVEANRKVVDDIVWPHFWAVQLWLLILLLIYCSLRELVRALGREKVIAMFFRDPN